MPDPHAGTTAAIPAAPTAAPPAQPIPYALPETSRPYQAGDAQGLTRRDVASLALKLVGIYALLQGTYLLVYLPGLLISYREWSTTVGVEMLFLGLGPYALSLAIGVVLVLFGDRLAPRLLPHSSAAAGLGPPTLVRTTGPELQGMAFSVVGVLLVVWSARSLILAAWGLSQSQRADLGIFREQGWGQYLLQFALEFGAGVWLFFGSKRLAAFWQRLRGQGAPAADDTGAGHDGAKRR
jgi:hypothetical protein